MLARTYHFRSVKGRKRDAKWASLNASHLIRTNILAIARGPELPKEVDPEHGMWDHFDNQDDFNEIPSLSFEENCSNQPKKRLSQFPDACIMKNGRQLHFLKVREDKFSL